MSCEVQTLGCGECGLVQSAALAPHYSISCRRCRSPLARGVPAGIDAPLAASVAAVLLFVPAIAAPMLTTTLAGASRTSALPSGAIFLWREGWPWLSIAVFLFVLIFPAVRMATLTIVLVELRRGRTPSWLRPCFRLVNALEAWAMLDVCLVATAAAYWRLQDTLLVNVHTGGYCFVAVTILSLIVRASLDKERVWTLIAPGVIPSDAPDAIVCVTCRHVLAPHAGRDRCIRCGGVATRARSDSIRRPIALLLGAVVLYLPANFFPMATLPINLTPTPYTVLGGIMDLVDANFWGLALLIFGASFAVPLMKLAGMSWCSFSVLRESNRHLVGKTRVHRWLEELGRWSMVDPFTIACMLPLVHYNSLIDGRADAAASPFAGVVILTMWATKTFDGRVLWQRDEETR